MQRITSPAEFKRWLKRERRRQKLSELQLAARCNPSVHPDTIKRIEAGENVPSFEKMLVIAKALGREMLLQEAAA